MTTRTRGSCRCLRRPELSLPAVALSVLLAAPADGSPGAGPTVLVDPASSTAGMPTDGAQELYLDVELNRVATGRLARVVLVDDRLHASAATLRGLDLAWPGSEAASGLVSLDALDGLQAHYDASRQRVVLLASVDLLGAGPVRLGYRAPAPLPADAGGRMAGLVLNYDLYGQQGDGYRSLSAWNELRLFGVGRGVFVNTATLGTERGDRRDGHEALRLDTFWEYDDPGRMVTVTVGDTVSGAPSWARPTRIGGIRVARNFGLQPYRITTPLASFAGEAALPSTVDILINGIRQSSQQVQPGQFVIDSAPLLSGAGQAQMVITDINGQRRVMEFALYGTPQLLEPGLADWSLELGAVRRRYGQASFDYAGRPVLSATGRRGMSARTTLEGHAQLADDLQLAGAGGAWRLGERAGVLTAAVAGSRHMDLHGTLASLGYQWNSPRFNLHASSLRRSAGFRDVASLEAGALPRRTDQVFAGFNTGFGQFGGSYVLQADQHDRARRYATLNWSRLLSRNALLSFSYSRALDDAAGSTAYLYWSLPLGRSGAVSATARHGDRGRSLAAGAHRAPPADLGGWGWRAQASAGEQAGMQAVLTRLGQHGQWTLGANHWRGDGPSRTSTYLSGNGGLVFVRGHAYAMRRVDDAFAVVDTNGFAGVPVRLENRIVGHTDDNGLLLVARLNAWQANRLSIDPLDLPFDTRLGDTTIEAVPQRRSGTLAAFEVERLVPRELALHDAGGRPVAAGSPVWLDRDHALAGATSVTVVGHDGQVWLAHAPPGAVLHVRVGDTLCSAPLDAAGDRGDINPPVEVPCR